MRMQRSRSRLSHIVHRKVVLLICIFYPHLCVWGGGTEDLQLESTASVTNSTLPFVLWACRAELRAELTLCRLRNASKRWLELCLAEAED